MTDADRIMHDAFSAAIVENLAPEGAMETQLAQRIATDSWRLNRISAGFTGTDAAPSAMTSSFAPAQGVMSGIIIDTNLAAMTGSTAKANIYFGTMGVASTTMSTIVQLAQAF